MPLPEVTLRVMPASSLFGGPVLVAAVYVGGTFSHVAGSVHAATAEVLPDVRATWDALMERCRAAYEVEVAASAFRAERARRCGDN